MTPIQLRKLVKHMKDAIKLTLIALLYYPDTYHIAASIADYCIAVAECLLRMATLQTVLQSALYLVCELLSTILECIQNFIKNSYK